MKKQIIFFVMCLVTLFGCSKAQQSTDTVSKAENIQTVTEMPTPTAVPSTPTPTLVPTPTPTPEPTPELPLAGRIICIDPGHCISNVSKSEPMSPLSDVTKPQYTRGTSGKNLSEVELNLIVGLMLKEELEALGAEIVMTREVNEVTISGLERVEIGNSSGADFVIRIHADGSTDPSVHGVSTLVPSGNLMGHPEIKDESIRLGQLMVDCVAEKTGAKNLGAIPRSDLQGHNWSQIPSVFIEMGYMTNVQEDALLETEEYQQLIVEGMVESIWLWYESR